MDQFSSDNDYNMSDSEGFNNFMDESDSSSGYVPKLKSNAKQVGRPVENKDEYAYELNFNNIKVPTKAEIKSNHKIKVPIKAEIKSNHNVKVPIKAEIKSNHNVKVPIKAEIKLKKAQQSAKPAAKKSNNLHEDSPYLSFRPNKKSVKIKSNNIEHNKIVKKSKVTS